VRLHQDDQLIAELTDAVPIPKARLALGDMGRSKLYQELAAGNLRAVKQGARTLITVESIRSYQETRRKPATFRPPVRQPSRFDDLERRKHRRRRGVRGG
jgi:hypothetical protein